MQLAPLSDPFGRIFSYLRLSLTERCNFRCSYCLPDGYQAPPDRSADLTLEEIQYLLNAFSELGITKVRLTGGEPTLRRDLLAIVESINQVEGVTEIGLSTNGFRLGRLAKDLKSAGVTALNVSIDSLRPTRFLHVTGEDRLHQVLEGVDEALALGFSRVKINTVLLHDMPSEEIDGFLSFVESRPVTVRFIELMQTGDNLVFFQKHHLSPVALRERLEKSGWRARPRRRTDGPAIEFTHPDAVGSMGLITPYGKDFCTTCNRLRISAQGALKLCLFGDAKLSLRHLLQHPDQKQELQDTIFKLLSEKTYAHALDHGKTGSTQNLSVIGG